MREVRSNSRSEGRRGGGWSGGFIEEVRNKRKIDRAVEGECEEGVITICIYRVRHV